MKRARLQQRLAFIAREEWALAARTSMALNWSFTDFRPIQPAQDYGWVHTCRLGCTKLARRVKMGPLVECRQSCGAGNIIRTA